jgi:hypothetical protein
MRSISNPSKVQPKRRKYMTSLKKNQLCIHAHPTPCTNAESKCGTTTLVFNENKGHTYIEYSRMPKFTNIQSFRWLLLNHALLVQLSNLQKPAQYAAKRKLLSTFCSDANSPGRSGA